ncbi:MAG: hypothetical protein WBA13_08585 [Microcoleaceae cyanobacterium]
MIKTTNSPIKQLLLTTLTTLTILGISIIHQNLEQSVINNLLNSSSQFQLQPSSSNESLAFVGPASTPFREGIFPN